MKKLQMLIIVLLVILVTLLACVSVQLRSMQCTGISGPHGQVQLTCQDPGTQNTTQQPTTTDSFRIDIPEDVIQAIKNQATKKPVKPEMN
jgi:hypothetical protein